MVQILQSAARVVFPTHRSHPMYLLSCFKTPEVKTAQQDTQAPLICPPLTRPVHNPARYSELGKAAPSSRQPLPTLCPCTCSFLSPSSALKASIRYAPLSVRSFLRHPMSKRKDCLPWLSPAALQAQHFYYSTITLFHNHFPQHECEPMAHFLFISSI